MVQSQGRLNSLPHSDSQSAVLVGKRQYDVGPGQTCKTSSPSQTSRVRNSGVRPGNLCFRKLSGRFWCLLNSWRALSLTNGCLPSVCGTSWDGELTTSGEVYEVFLNTPANQTPGHFVSLVLSLLVIESLGGVKIHTHIRT